MGFYDRDYSRAPSRPAFGNFSTYSVSTWLIGINVLVFVLDQMMNHQLFGLGYFSASTAIYSFQLWRFVTFQFLHANAGHIFFNMFSLYMFGPMVERYLGRRRFTAFYLLCGIAGAATYVLLWWLGILDRGAGSAVSGADTPLVGASAGIFGVLIAAAQIAPDVRIMLMFPPIPMRMRTFALLLIGIAVFTVFSSGANAGGQAAHLGGAALGALLFRFPQALAIFDGFSSRPRRGGGFHADLWR